MRVLFVGNKEKRECKVLGSNLVPKVSGARAARHKGNAGDCLSLLNLADFLIGFIVVFGCLFLVGMTRGKFAL